MKVHDFATTNYIDLSPQNTIRETIAAFLNNRHDICCITSRKKLIGIVHKYSIYKALLSQYSMDDSINDLVNQDVVIVYKNQDLIKARDVMITGNVSQAVVLDDQKEVCGIMTKSDIVTSNMTVLQDTLDRMKSLIENLQDAVISVDKDLKIAAFNTTLIQLFDLNPETLTGSSIDLIFPSFKNLLINTLDTEEIHDAKRIDFNSLSVIASFIPIRQIDKITGVMVVLRDITSFENIAGELESTNNIKKTLDSALELAYDGVAITNNYGYITMVNQGFRKLYKFQENQQLIGQSIANIAPEINYQQSLTYDKKIEGELVDIKNKKCIIAQMPIYQKNKKIGAIFKIIFEQLETWKDILFHMDKLEHQVTYYRDELIRLSKGSKPFSQIISVSVPMERLKEEATVAAKSHSNVLITGDSGTGKELVAEGIHQSSEKEGAFITVNCAAIPEELLEAEFFGYVEGAFTGAKKGGKPGKFELADGGTLFLDEIGEMPLSLQVKLLRVIQEQEFERVGATKSTKVNVRIVSATNKDLLSLIAEGKFREDLYYRIHVIQLNIPSLRERPDDIPMLCKHFIDRLNHKMDEKSIIGVSPDVIQSFEGYDWPGNVRELENVLERAFHFSNSNWIELDHLPKEFNKADKPITRNEDKQPAQTSEHMVRKDIISDADKQAILQALKQCQGNRTKAAKLLGISRTTLYNKINQYHIKEEINYVTNPSH